MTIWNQPLLNRTTILLEKRKLEAPNMNKYLFAFNIYIKV